ncbi:hypothetical protein DV451_005044 [Geotrichum candidum]|nr:hypothetical protein DV451_005044 [Geotrichum candidum]
MSYEDCLYFYKEHLKKPLDRGDILASSAKLLDNFEIFVNAVGNAEAFAAVMFLDLLGLKNFTYEFFRENKLFTTSQIKQTLDKLYGRLRLNDETPAFFAGTDSTESKSTFSKCERCGKPGHSAARCVIPAEECLNLKGVLANLPRKTKKKSGGHVKPINVWPAWHVSDAKFCHVGKWYFDTGAAGHICCDVSMMYNVKPYKGVVRGVGGDAPVECIGSVDLTAVLPDGTTDVITLKRVLYVPSLGVNLLSASSAPNVSFTLHKGKLYADWSGIECLLATVNDSNLWELNLKPIWPTDSRAVVPATPILAAVPASVWHQRLGHASESSLKRLAGPLKISPGEISKACSHPSCTVCVQGKSTIRPLTLSKSRASRPLELLHTDVSGPKNVPNIDGSLYFVTIIDDYSRFAHVSLVANKSDTQTCLRQFILDAEAAFSGQGFKVQKIRSDNGGEYSSHVLAEFLSERGIEHNFTVPYKPQQNGRAERLNRTLQDKARCLLIQSKLPHQFWGEAILTATFIYNRLPCSAHGDAPAALWNGVTPDLKLTRVFGCSVHVVIPRARREAKFDSLTVEGVFIGYSVHRKAFRVFTKDGRVVESADVVFDETLFPGVDSGVLAPTSVGADSSTVAVSHSGYTHSSPPADASAVAVTSPSEELPDADPSESLALPLPEPVISTQGEAVVRQFSEYGVSDSTDYEDFHEYSDAQDPKDAPSTTVTNVPTTRGPAASSTIVVDISSSESDDIYPRRPRTRGTLRTAELLVPASQPITRTYTERASSNEHEPSRPRPTSSPSDTLHPVEYTERRDDTKNTSELVLLATPATLTYGNAMASPDADYWRQACQSEIDSLMLNNTWTLVKSPPGRKAIGSKWVFKVKENVDGSIDRYKARLVAQGFSQIEGIDYNETFAPVVRYETVRLLFAISAQFQMLVHHMDVTTAFLNGDLSEEIYMKQPKGFEEKGHEDLVCKLNKSLYGLKQAPSCWNEKIGSVLTSLGFSRNESDYGLYSEGSGRDLIFLALYVDDLLIAGANPAQVDTVKGKLASVFKMKDLGPASYFLGMRINQTKDFITLDVSKYVTDTLKHFGMSDSKSAPTPLPSTHLSEFKDSDPDADATLFRSIVGKLIYAANCARPDLATAVGFLSRHMKAPKAIHLNAAKHTLRYLAGTVDLGITYRRQNKFELVGYADADWGSDSKDRISISGYLFKLSGGPLTWACRKQKTVAGSSSEAEYVALSEAAKECVWLLQITSEMKIDIPKPVTIHEDNQGCIAIAQNSVHHQRTKNMDIKYHISRQLAREGVIHIEYLRTEVMIADMFTKSLDRVKFRELRDLLGMAHLGNSVTRGSVGNVPVSHELDKCVPPEVFTYLLSF